MSSLIPFLVFTGMSQHNIYKQRKSFMSYHKSRSSATQVSLPEKMSVIFDRADKRTNGVSYFDLLMMREIHSDENVQKVIFKLSENYDAINKQTKAKMLGYINDIASKSQKAYNALKVQYEDIKAMAVDIKFPIRETDLFFEKDDYNASGVLQSDNKNGYKTKLFDFPETLNGLDINSDAFTYENPYLKQLNDYLKDNPNNEHKLLNAKKYYKKLNRNKLALMFNKQRREELKNAQMEFDKYTEIANNIEKIQTNVDFYKNLTAEQKKEISDFIQNINDIKDYSNEVQKYLQAVRLIDKNNSMVCPMEKINEYHAAVIKKAAMDLSQEDIDTLIEFEEKSANKILALSDEEAKEIIKNSAGISSSFEIDGKVVDYSILYELSNSCHEKIQEISAEQQAQTNQEIEK